ncbi:hypothetical protein G6F56_001441 [Rhizopus delemar]|nr:hypothetical protein G6F56_001441 [Rhizopus delemar]
MSAWKAAGISYLQYANICARAVRNSLKDEVRAVAVRRDRNNLKVQKWENGVGKEQARNEEKAQSMLYRFREAQAAQLGLAKTRQRRPGFAGTVNSVTEAEMWRRDLLGEVSRKIAKIQDVSLSDYQVRDLNDEINKLMGQKYHWEKRIVDLGGPDYRRSGPRMISYEGREAPGIRGYRYFGRARDLPGVRELFEQAASEPVNRSITEISRDIDADYYGYRDEENKLLLEYEKALEKELVQKLLHAPVETLTENEETA